MVAEPCGAADFRRPLFWVFLVGLMAGSPSRGSDMSRPNPGSPGLLESGQAGQTYGALRQGHEMGRTRGQALGQDLGVGVGSFDPWSNGRDRWSGYMAQTQGLPGGNYPAYVTSGCPPVPPSTSGSSSSGNAQCCWSQGFVTQPGRQGSCAGNVGGHQVGSSLAGGASVPFFQTQGSQACGMVPGSGMRPDPVLSARHMMDSMNARELQTVLQELTQRLRTENPGHFVPERLGGVPPDPNVPAFARPESQFFLPGPGQGLFQQKEDDRDVFSRSEKWLSSPPSANHEAWRSREDEVLGMNRYVQELTSWANQASVEFGREIMQAARWSTQIGWNGLSRAQQNRSVRLFSVIKTAFHGHGRISLLIQGFSEGLDIVQVTAPREMQENVLTYGSNGFELLRQLSREFSLRNRSEAVDLRAALMSRSFQSTTSQNAPVADTVRQIEVAVARYVKMVSTLDATDMSGLHIADSDQMTLLMRSLPHAARDHVLHHSGGDTYGSYRAAALKWEHKQRLFTELSGSKKMFSLQEGSPTGDNAEDGHFVSENDPSQEGPISALKGTGKGSGGGASKSAEKCTRCGKRGHVKDACTADLTKTKCFKCNSFGHISLNCQKSSNVKASPSGTSQDGSPKVSSGGGSPKGKGKGKGGKKGKMFAVFDEDSQQWWYTEASGEEAWQPESQNATEELVVISSLIGSVPQCLNENEPNTQCFVPQTDSDVVFMNPLLQSLGHQLNQDFWLLDSGASCCVINRETLKHFSHDDLMPCSLKFTAANGSAVAFDGCCNVVVKVRVRNAQGEIKNGVFKLLMMVGQTPYNIISTLALGKQGWQVILDSGVSVRHGRNALSMVDTALWCDTPWVKVFQHSGSDFLLAVPPSDQSSQPAQHDDAGDDAGQLFGLKRRNVDELHIHRAKGHMPFHPECEHCLKSKGVFQHRKRTEKGLQSEIVADFMYLSGVGETIAVEEQPSAASVKVLVLRESFSGSIGAVVITDNVEKDRSLFLKWLGEFGLESSSTSITLITDAEDAVKSFVTRSSDQYAFLVRKAAPQAHEQVGGAERTVRTIKETLATLQSEFQALGYVLGFKRDILQLVMNYICFNVNVNGSYMGSDRSPREVAVGRRLPA